MENRLRSKRKIAKPGTVEKAFKKVRESIDSRGEGVVDLEIPQVIQESIDTKMGETVEALRGVGQLMADVLARQTEIMNRREEEQIVKFTEIINKAQDNQKQNAELLAQQFEKMRLEKIENRGRQVHTLVKYDGQSMTVDDWQDKTESVIKGNGWDCKKFFENIPASLLGMAKRAYDTLEESDRQTIEGFFSAIRLKIDPQAVERNKSAFTLARRGNNEGIINYIDRLRMYIRRGQGDPNESFVKEMIKIKIFDCLPTTDSKILKATILPSDTLETIAIKADGFLAVPSNFIGAVTEGKVENDMQNNGNRFRQTRGQGYTFRGTCWECSQQGHMARYCPQRNDQNSQNLNVQRGQNRGSNTTNFSNNGSMLNPPYFGAQPNLRQNMPNVSSMPNMSNMPNMTPSTTAPNSFAQTTNPSLPGFTQPPRLVNGSNITPPVPSAFVQPPQPTYQMGNMNNHTTTNNSGNRNNGGGRVTPSHNSGGSLN